MRVKNYLGISPIHGLGVFTAEDIQAGDVIWSYEENFDRRFTVEDFSKMSTAIQEYYQTYGYHSTADRMIYLPFDNDRFMNHSFVANTVFKPDGNFYALVDIAKDQEITCDYREFDTEWPRYAHEFEVLHKLQAAE